MLMKVWYYDMRVLPRFGSRLALVTMLSGLTLLAQSAAPPYPQSPYSQPGAYPQAGQPAPYGDPSQGQYPPYAGQDPSGQQDQIPPDVAGPGVARISLLMGDASVRRGDSPDPVAANINAPMMAGDTLGTGPNARAEIQFDFADRLRIGGSAELRIAGIDNGRFEVELAHGTSTASILRQAQSQLEIHTPSVAIRPLQPGEYRITVQDDGQTVITAWRGQVEIATERGTERINAGQTMYVRGTGANTEFQAMAAIPRDEWDTWNEQRDRTLESSNSYRYVSHDIPGAEDLDANGRWTYDPAYGNVWAPNVSPGWSPYSDGNWTWEDYYGWTWVDNAPWGWAPFHYGNWYYGSVGWSWYPGPLYRPYFWRPAMVAFFGFGGGGFGFGLGFGNIGWVALAPFERYCPWYGRGFYGGYHNAYFNSVHNVNVVNVYRNARVAGGAMGMHTSAFTGGQYSGISRVNSNDLHQAGLVRGAVPLAPTANNLRFNSRPSSVTPRALNNSSFYSRTPLAAANRMPFQQQQQSIARSTVRTPAAAANSFGNRTPVAQNRESTGRQPSSAWSRFGSPPSSAPRSNYAQPAAPAQNRAAGGASSSWGRFGTPPARSQDSWSRFNHSSDMTPRASEPARGYGQSYTGNSGRALQIAPQIVQPYGRSSAPSGYSGNRSYPESRGYSAPSRSYSPPSRSYSAPSRGGSSGGSQSHSSSPTPRGSGGGSTSGSHSSGGGHSHR